MLTCGNAGRRSTAKGAIPPTDKGEERPTLGGPGRRPTRRNRGLDPTLLRRDRTCGQFCRRRPGREALHTADGRAECHADAPAIEIATIVRLVSWSSADDILILSRIIRRSRRAAFEVGRLNAKAEAEEGTE
jgi:hypothetical protein